MEILASERDLLAPTGLLEGVEQAMDGIVLGDRNGRITYVNPAFCRLTGYSIEEALGQHASFPKPARELPQSSGDLPMALRSGRPWQGEFSCCRKDGIEYRQEMRITPVKNADGAVVSTIAINRDVTDRHAGENAHALFASIVENSADAIVTFDANHRILTWNRTAEVILGYSAAEASGRDISMILPSDQYEGFSELSRRVFDNIPVTEQEGVYLCRDGRRIATSVTASPLRTARGITAVSLILRDVSERREAERAQALQASIVESSEEAIYSTSFDGAILSWNHGAEALLGYSSRQVVGKNARFLVPPGESGGFYECLTDIKEGRSVPPFETTLQGNDGEIQVGLAVSPLRDSAGKVIGASVIAGDIKKRASAERKLQESEERFREVFENAPYGMAVVLTDRLIIQVNAALGQMLGYSAEELLAAYWGEMTHAGDLEASLLRWRQLESNEALFVEAEERYVHRDGHTVWGRVRMSAVSNSDGTPAYVVLQVEDITAHREAELALRESEDRFRTMADGCPTMIWVTNAEGRPQFVNCAYLLFFGVTNAQVESGDWNSRVHRDDIERYAEALSQAARGRTPFVSEARHRRADGEWRWLSASGEPRFSADGEYLGHGGISIDITGRKQAEEALRESEESYRRQFADNSAMMLLIDPLDGRVVDVNASALNFYGYAKEQVVGKIVTDLTTLAPAEIRQVLTTVVRKKCQAFEFQQRMSDGSLRDVEVSASRIRFGSHVLLHAIVFDITARKRAEDELRIARQSAESASQAKTDFLANMSHEIRTPMNGVLGMVQLMLSDDLDAQQRKRAEVLQTSGQSLLTLLNDILDISKLEARKMELEVIDFDLRTLIEGVADLMAVKAQEKGLEFVCRIHPEVPTQLVGDPNRLRQILLNLVGNSVKFTSAGSVSVEVSLDSTEAALRFEIRDTGIGIPEEKRRNLFQPFSQVDPSMARRYGGTGLGLSIVRNLVTMMEGQLGLESTVGEGSCFWFTAVLPSRPAARPPAPSLAGLKVPEGEDNAVKKAAGQQKIPPGRRSSFRLLLVEDNLVNQEVALGILEKLGYHADVVEDGLSAIRALGQTGYDLVLMDCQMAGMDGYEASRRIRQPDSPVRDHSIPIIAMTAHAMSDAREKCLEAGMNGYLAKPIESGLLAQLLERWLVGREPRNLPAPPKDSKPSPVIFDEEGLMDRVIGDGRLAQKVIASFLSTYPQQVAALAQACSDSNADAAWKTAHAIKGAAATAGGLALSEAARTAERLGQMADFDSLSVVLRELEREIERLRPELARFCERE